MSHVYVYVDHRNDLGDHCPWSGQPVQGMRPDDDPDDHACPAGCYDSRAVPEGDE